jgi:DNA-binding response OmpR family regulator
MRENKILIIDDDPGIRKFVRANLEARNYKVYMAIDGEEGIQVLEKELPDLILLDIMMPKIDGFEVCKKVREWSKTPIIMLSARDGETDKVRCLDCGADDYLTKPFSLNELLSRIKAVLRRVQDQESTLTQPKYNYENLQVNLAQNKVFLDENELYLTGTEYKILAYLVINAGRIITTDQLLEKIWGEDYIGDNHLIQVNMARLRSKLLDTRKISKYIETRPGIGYMLKVRETTF